jgi:hypothetical protein
MASLKRFATLGSGVAPSSTDPQFNLTTLLLHGDGTNGAQNNTFIDSSSNNFTITRNGNSTQGTFTPFSQTGWGNFCSGGNRLAADDASKLELGSSDFTIEFFAYFTQFPTNQAMVFEKGSFVTTRSYRTYISATQIFFELNLSGSATGAYTSITLNTTNSLNVWHHFAFVRSGSTVYIFRNGVLIGTGAVSGAVFDNAAALTFGGPADGNSIFAFTGYLSNFRITTGQAFSTVTFIAPSSPLTTSTTGWLTASQNPISLTGTVAFLTAQSNRFIDVSASPTNITIAAGSPSVQAFSPFAPTVPYSTSVVGGSGYFDGSGDYISAPDNALLQFETGTFTIQGWVYRAVAGATHTIASKGASTPTGWVFQVNSSNQLVFTHTSTDITTTTTIPANTWTHVAAVRSGTGTNQMVLFINGVSSATGTVATNFNQANALNIGADRSNASTFNGYISGLEIVKGSALTITVPTSPPTTSNSPSLLLNFTNAGIFDQTAKNDLETVGNAQISTSVKKFGTGSLAFDGTGDWLTFIDRPTTQLGSGDFTIEGWVYINTAGVAYGLISKGTATTGWSVNITSGDKLQFSYTASNLTGATSLAANTWYYFAVVRSGTATGNLKVYLDGVVDATSGGAVTDNFNQTSIGYVGADRVAGSALNGYLDDVRITLAARTITTPTSAFPDQ